MLITYNSKDVFTDQLEPMIGKTTSFPSNGDNRMLVEDKITLVGELTGCNLSGLLDARKQVIDVFADNFKTLVIGGVGSFTKAKIESITFDESPYLASLPYNISLVHYPDGGYEFGFGITNPKNSYTYVENTNGTLSISQQVSAQGINTTSSYPGNGLENATAFVKDLLDYDIPRPATIDTLGTDFGMYLVEFSEEIDKLNKIVTINRTFETDMSAALGAIILRYTSQLAETEGEEVTIAYNGTVDAGRENDLVDAREKYEKFRDGLGETTFINENVTEDPNINNISFSFTCVRGPQMMDDYTITLEENSDSSLFSVSINGNITTRGKCMSAANYELIEAEYNDDSSEGHRFDVCQSLYNDFYTTDRGSHQENPGVGLGKSVIAKSIGFNEYDQSASYSASYNDRQVFYGMHSLDFTVTLTPSLFPVKAVPSAYTKGWIFEDLGYRSRAKFSISLTAKSSGDVLPHSSLKNLSTQEYHKFVKGGVSAYVTMDQYSVNNKNVASATYAASFHSSKSFTDNDDYTTIRTFEL
jgi:hypothetical protein